MHAATQKHRNLMHVYKLKYSQIITQIPDINNCNLLISMGLTVINVACMGFLKYHMSELK